MKLLSSAVIATTVVSAATTVCDAFTPLSNNYNKKTANPSSVQSSTAQPTVEQATNAPLYDPLGLYPKNSRERKQGLIRPLEETPQEGEGPVKDPLGLYANNKAEVEADSAVEMSSSLPFLRRPEILRGVPGDRAFDPFNFASDDKALQWQRTAEIKHARLAMLAAVGWPLSELFDKKLASVLDLKPVLGAMDRVPSVLNGGLDKVPGTFWAAVLGITFAIESIGILRETRAEKKIGMESYVPGDLGFDPLGLAKGKTPQEKHGLLEAEIFNGRLAMLAITGFALQEWWTQTAVINQTPIFFKPFGAVVEQILSSGGDGISV